VRRLVDAGLVNRVRAKDPRRRPEQCQEFLDDLQTTLLDLFTCYGGAEGDACKLAVACYAKGKRRE